MPANRPEARVRRYSLPAQFSCDAITPGVSLLPQKAKAMELRHPYLTQPHPKDFWTRVKIAPQQPMKWRRTRRPQTPDSPAAFVDRRPDFGIGQRLVSFSRSGPCAKRMQPCHSLPDTLPGGTVLRNDSGDCFIMASDYDLFASGYPIQNAPEVGFCLKCAYCFHEINQSSTSLSSSQYIYGRTARCPDSRIACAEEGDHRRSDRRGQMRNSGIVAYEDSGPTQPAGQLI